MKIIDSQKSPTYYLTSFEKAARTILIEDEGLRYNPYRDTKGNWTIGVGHYIGPVLEKLVLDLDTCMFMLMKDIGNKVDDLHNLYGEEFYESLPRPRQLALLSWAFTMSRRSQETFVNFNRFVKAGDWDNAAREVLDSKWASDVDPRHTDHGRDNRIAFMIKTGKFHEAYDL